jgi:hypothetical protein
MRGLSEAKGSWKIICISRRSARSSARPRRATSTTPPPLTRMRISPAVGSIARMRQRAVGRLATAALPHEPQRLALVDVEVHAVHRADMPDRPLQEAPANREELLKPLHLQERLGGRRARRRGGRHG